MRVDVLAAKSMGSLNMKNQLAVTMIRKESLEEYVEILTVTGRGHRGMTGRVILESARSTAVDMRLVSFLHLL